MGYTDLTYEAAEEIKDKYETSNPYHIISAEGIELKHYRFQEIKGFYFVQNGFRFIALNSNLDSLLKRIVAAHELGHDILHRNYAENFVMNDIALYGNSLKIEREANDFAANLLLSDKTVWDEYMDCELGTEYSSVTIYPKQLLYHKFTNMQRRGFDLPDSLISAVRV